MMQMGRKPSQKQVKSNDEINAKVYVVLAISKAVYYNTYKYIDW